MNVDIIGVPIDLGASRRGVDMGPSAIRYAGLEQALAKLRVDSRDLGNIETGVRENLDDRRSGGGNDGGMKYADEITRVNAILAEKVRESVSKGHLPLVLGGDHSIAIGTVMGAQTAKGCIGVIWIDAHGDFNTNKTTLSGNLHGMSLAACVGKGDRRLTSFKAGGVGYIRPENIALIGARDIDDEEAVLIRESGINVFTMEDIDMYGMRDIMKKALEVAGAGTEGFHLSFDVDSLSPSEAPGVGTPVYGGLTYREAHLAAEMIAQSGRLCSMEFVEVNPILDTGNKTGLLTVSLICSCLGKRII